jgi:hypothetical protein
MTFQQLLARFDIFSITLVALSTNCYIDLQIAKLEFSQKC